MMMIKQMARQEKLDYAELFFMCSNVAKLKNVFTNYDRHYLYMLGRYLRDCDYDLTARQFDWGVKKLKEFFQLFNQEIKPFATRPDQIIFSATFRDKDKTFLSNLSNSLASIYPKIQKDIIFLCIGSDMSLGDSFGPLVGSLLTKKKIKNVLGTITDPVDGLNIVDTVNKLGPDKYIIAIDASITSLDTDLEEIYIRTGPCQPGAGIGNNLVTVGDISIGFNICSHPSGVVERDELETIGLSKVYPAAETLATAISKSYKQYLKNCISL